MNESVIYLFDTWYSSITQDGRWNESVIYLFDTWYSSITQDGRWNESVIYLFDTWYSSITQDARWMKVLFIYSIHDIVPSHKMEDEWKCYLFIRYMI